MFTWLLWGTVESCVGSPEVLRGRNKHWNKQSSLKVNIFGVLFFWRFHFSPRKRKQQNILYSANENSG